VIALLGAFVAGVLTTLAPCVLPLLPVIVGGSVVADPPPAGGGSVAVATRPGPLLQRYRGSVIIAVSLAASIIVFTLALKASTALIGIPPYVWEWVSGALLIGLGVFALFPQVWERLSMATNLQGRSTARLQAARGRKGVAGQVLTGAALGPVFTSCSPLYGYVIVTVLPASFGYGMVLLLAYVIGLSGTLLLIAVLGRRAVAGARWAADPHGWFRRGLGAVFVLVGVLILTGWMKDIETWLVLNSPLKPWNLDQGFIPVE
jgi:cytochrome c-type biogenesis protein